MIAVRFIADNSWESRGIRLRTLGNCSHVEYVDTEKGNYRTFGARLKGGICHRPYDYCNPTWEEWYSFEGIEASYAEALKSDGRKYDFRDILDLLVGWHPAEYDPQRAICSVLVGYSNRLAWADGKAPALVNPNLPTSMMTPALLYGCVTQMVKKVK